MATDTNNALSIGNYLLCPKDFKLAMDKSTLSEEDGNKLIEFVPRCSQLENLVFPNLARSQRSTFTRKIQNLPLRSISFDNKSPGLGEVFSVLNQPFRRVLIRSQTLTPTDTAQLSRTLAKGTIDRLDMADCMFEDTETLARGLKSSKVTNILMATPTFENTDVNCYDVVKSLRKLRCLKIARVTSDHATAALRASAEKSRLQHISVRLDHEDLDDAQMHALTSAMASAVITNKRVTSVGYSIFDSDNLELLTTSLSRSKYLKELALYIEDCTDRVLKLIVPLIRSKRRKLSKLKLKFVTNLTYDQSAYISTMLNGTHAISNVTLANLFPDPILARLCSRGSSVQKLKLKYCKFISSSMEYIGTIMTNSNTDLEVLDLTGSIINTEQLEQLTEHVSTLCRRSLKQICVYVNNVDLAKPTEATSVKNFIRSLDKHRTLQKIDIYGAYMDEEISRMILDLVTNNKIGKFNFDMEEAENTKMEELEDKINQILQYNRCNMRRIERIEKQIDLAQKIIYQSDRGNFKEIPGELIHRILRQLDEDNMLL